MERLTTCVQAYPLLHCCFALMQVSSVLFIVGFAVGLAQAQESVSRKHVAQV